MEKKNIPIEIFRSCRKRPNLKPSLSLNLQSVASPFYYASYITGKDHTNGVNIISKPQILLCLFFGLWSHTILPIYSFENQRDTAISNKILLNI